MSNPNAPLSEVEFIKERSNYLRGTLKESLENEITGGLASDDIIVIKFHGSYQQFDRELESERKKQKLEPLYSMMTRVRIPGGILSPSQWLKTDEIADKLANGTIKLTTRQAVQFHGIKKRNLKPLVQAVNEVLLDTIAACGDVNRNVMLNPNPYLSAVHNQVYEIAKKINTHLTPNTNAYNEIWLDKAPLANGDTEPIYGKTYLPRKFKIAIAIPPYNDSDIYANDLGLIAIEENGTLIGFNISVGGGMGMTFGDNTTYPRLGNVIGFSSTDTIIDVAEKTLIAQRDLGNRVVRKHARLKYTIDRVGVEQFKQEIENRLGYALQPAKPFSFQSNGDTFGWTKGIDNQWHLTLFIEGGRVADTEKTKTKTALREIAKFHKGDFRLTGNQNLIIAAVQEKDKAKIDKILAQHHFVSENKLSALRLNSIACVALNTCSLAFAEAERYLPSLIDKLDVVIAKNNLQDTPIVIRMTGCPNGCGRPYLGEIGFVGKAPGRYNLYLGAGFSGDRLNKLYKENLNEEEILDSLTPILESYAQHRNNDERFGDFVVRQKYVAATTEGRFFHNQ